MELEWIVNKWRLPYYVAEILVETSFNNGAALKALVNEEIFNEMLKLGASCVSWKYQTEYFSNVLKPSIIDEQGQLVLRQGHKIMLKNIAESLQGTSPKDLSALTVNYINEEASVEENLEPDRQSKFRSPRELPSREKVHQKLKDMINHLNEKAAQLGVSNFSYDRMKSDFVLISPNDTDKVEGVEYRCPNCPIKGRKKIKLNWAFNAKGSLSSFSTSNLISHLKRHPRVRMSQTPPSVDAASSRVEELIIEEEDSGFADEQEEIIEVVYMNATESFDDNANQSFDDNAAHIQLFEPNVFF